MLFQPTVAVETSSAVKRMRSVIELHLFILGAEAVKIFLGLGFGDGIARGKLQEDAFTVSMAEKINGIVPRVLAEIFMDVVRAYLFDLRHALWIFAGESLFLVGIAAGHEIGRASCRERV